MYKHIIWDFDGTLFDSYPVMTSAMLSALDEIGIQESKNTILQLMKVSMSHMMTVLQEKYQVDEEFIARYNRLRKHLGEENMLPFPGAIEICQYIVDHKGYNHLFTHRGNSAITYLEKFALLSNFTGLITKESGFERKPSPEAIHFFMKEYAIPKDQALIIGDRDIDLLSAKNAGISTCYFNPDHYRSLDCADYTIRNFNELKDILSR